MTTRLLPFEILTAIFEKVDDVQDVRNIRATSRTFCAAAAPIAFRILSATGTTASAQNLGRLFDVPEIAAYVKEVAYCDASANWTPARARASATNELTWSFSRMHQLPQLETIDLTFFSTGDDSDIWSHLALQSSVLGALANSFSIRAPSKLSSLSLQNLRATDLVHLTFPSFQTVLKNLRCLRLSVVYGRSSDAVVALRLWRHFWSTLCYRLILTPTQDALTVLTLHTETPIGASSGFSLSGLYFPNLCAFSLRNILFDPSVGAEPFVLRHAATLTRLELLTCKLLIDGPTASDTMRWEHIWDSFATGLTALVALHVDESGNGALCHRSVRYEPLSYWEAHAPGYIDVADAAALERFYVTVTARSEEARGARYRYS